MRAAGDDAATCLLLPPACPPGHAATGPSMRRRIPRTVRGWNMVMLTIEDSRFECFSGTYEKMDGCGVGEEGKAAGVWTALDQSEHGHCQHRLVLSQNEDNDDDTWIWSIGDGDEDFLRVFQRGDAPEGKSNWVTSESDEEVAVTLVSLTTANTARLRPAAAEIESVYTWDGVEVMCPAIPGASGIYCVWDVCEEDGMAFRLEGDSADQSFHQLEMRCGSSREGQHGWILSVVFRESTVESTSCKLTCNLAWVVSMDWSAAPIGEHSWNAGEQLADKTVQITLVPYGESLLESRATRGGKALPDKVQWPHSLRSCECDQVEGYLEHHQLLDMRDDWHAVLIEADHAAATQCNGLYSRVRDGDDDFEIQFERRSGGKVFKLIAERIEDEARYTIFNSVGDRLFFTEEQDDSPMVGVAGSCKWVTNEGCIAWETGDRTIDNDVVTICCTPLSSEQVQSASGDSSAAASSLSSCSSSKTTGSSASDDESAAMTHHFGRDAAPWDHQLPDDTEGVEDWGGIRIEGADQLPELNGLYVRNVFEDNDGYEYQFHFKKIDSYAGSVCLTQQSSDGGEGEWMFWLRDDPCLTLKRVDTQCAEDDRRFPAGRHRWREAFDRSTPHTLLLLPMTARQLNRSLTVTLQDPVTWPGLRLIFDDKSGRECLSGVYLRLPEAESGCFDEVFDDHDEVLAQFVDVDYRYRLLVLRTHSSSSSRRRRRCNPVTWRLQPSSVHHNSVIDFDSEDVSQPPLGKLYWRSGTCESRDGVVEYDDTVEVTLIPLARDDCPPLDPMSPSVGGGESFETIRSNEMRIVQSRRGEGRRQTMLLSPTPRGGTASPTYGCPYDDEGRVLTDDDNDDDDDVLRTSTHRSQQHRGAYSSAASATELALSHSTPQCSHRHSRAAGSAASAAGYRSPSVDVTRAAIDAKLQEGMVFKLVGHPLPALNGCYQLSSRDHMGFPRFRNEHGTHLFYAAPLGGTRPRPGAHCDDDTARWCLSQSTNKPRRRDVLEEAAASPPDVDSYLTVGAGSLPVNADDQITWAQALPATSSTLPQWELPSHHKEEMLAFQAGSVSKNTMGRLVLVSAAYHVRLSSLCHARSPVGPVSVPPTESTLA